MGFQVAPNGPTGEVSEIAADLLTGASVLFSLNVLAVFMFWRRARNCWSPDTKYGTATGPGLSVARCLL